MRKKSVIFLSIVGTLFALLLLQHQPSAAAVTSPWETGKTYLAGNSSYVFTQKPSLAGSIPAGCTDVRIVISNDWTSGSDPTAHFYTYFETPHFSGNQVQLNTTTGEWLLDLTPSGLNYSIPYGIYHVDVMSSCGNNTSQYTDYSNPKYADRYSDAMHVYPYACYDANNSTAPGNTLCRPLYRLYNPRTNAYLLTPSDEEKRMAMDTSGGRTPLKLESILGFVQQASPAPLGDQANVWRFYTPKNDDHFYTTQDAERSRIEQTAQQNNVYREGLVFNVYPIVATQPYGTMAIYRIYNTNTGVHIYTASEAEYNSLIANSSQYRDEGRVFYLISK